MKTGWEVKYLEQLATIKTGKRDANHQNPDGTYPFYTCAFGQFRSSTFAFDGPSIILPGNGANVGKVFFYDGKFEAYQRTYVVNELSSIVYPWFLFYCFEASWLDYIANKQFGSATNYIVVGDLKAFPIPIPPFPEQQRIVGILDEAFEGIATARANAEKNLQNARTLFESHLQAVFADAWRAGELVTLTDLATDITDGDHMPPPKASNGVPFITIGNIHKGTRTIDFTDTFMVPKEYYEGLKPNKKPKSGDVLYTVTGSFGIPVLLANSPKFCFQRHIGLVRPKADVNSAWLYYLLMSPQVFKQANDGATGTAQKTVSLKLLRGFQVPKIPLSRQQSDVAKLDTLTEETQRLESIYQQKLNALDELKKSLLDQAFRGEL